MIDTCKVLIWSLQIFFMEIEERILDFASWWLAATVNVAAGSSSSSGRPMRI